MANKEDTPVLILHGSQQPYLSIGIRYGGIKLNGKEYVYLPQHDAFLRKDHERKYNKHIKERNSWDSFIEMIKGE